MAGDKTVKYRVDWESVEREYRVGIRSLRDIGDEFGCTEGAIRKKAKLESWDRDLSARIAIKADALVRKQEVRNQVRIAVAATEKEQIQANATMLADAVLNQRKDVTKARSVVQKLLAELEIQIDGLDMFAKLGELLSAPDESGIDKLNEIYRKVMSMPSRVDSARKLADSMRVLIELERKVLRIKDDDDKQQAGVTVMLSSQDAML